MPKISVIVPCYNQGEYLDEALSSVLKQSFSDWVCIIINDGSTDNSNIVAEQWKRKDSRFVYYEIKNSGVCFARNFGIEKAQSEFILPLDADDKVSPNYFEDAMNAWNSKPELKVIYANAERFGAENMKWNLKPFSLFNLAKGNIIYCSAFFRKKDWDRIGGYDINMKEGYEDWEFWLNLLKNGGEVLKLEETCFYYRIKPESRNTSINQEKKEKLLKYLSIKHADLFVEHFGSFHNYMEEGIKENHQLKSTLRSRKHALNVLFKGLFNFWKY